MNSHHAAALLVALLVASDAVFAQDSYTRTAIGVTRTGTAIEAFITREDLDIHSPKKRILIVGGLNGSQRTTAVARAWLKQFESLPATERMDIVLSAIPCGNPDGLARQTLDENGAGGNPARGYPPSGDAYLSATNPESQYLWRWIGMHGPDMVIELVDGDKLDWLAASSLPADCLAAALPKFPACNVGTIEARALVVPADCKLPIEFIAQVASASPATPAPASARAVLQKRDQRTALEVAQQLDKVYGHELPTVAYIPAVACLGRLRLSGLNHDQSTLPDLLQLVRSYRTGQTPTLTDKSTASDVAGHILWGELFDATQDKRFIELARAAADRAFDAEGRPLPAMPQHSEMSDSVFMGCPILAQVGRLTGESKYFDMCLKHMRFMLKLNLRSDGLHRHSPQDESAWGRGNGFPALGLALALDEIPTDYPGRQEMLMAFQSHLRALLLHQDVTGAWHQVIDHSESYRELTSTCMITYAMIRGVRRGWLERKAFEPAIAKGWTAVKARVAEDGSLVDVCTGTGKMKSLREYLDRTAILGRDPRGGAMSLLVATEMAQWEKDTVTKN